MFFNSNLGRNYRARDTRGILVAMRATGRWKGKWTVPTPAGAVETDIEFNTRLLDDAKVEFQQLGFTSERQVLDLANADEKVRDWYLGWKAENARIAAMPDYMSKSSEKHRDAMKDLAESSALWSGKNKAWKVREDDAYKMLAETMEAIKHEKKEAFISQKAIWKVDVLPIEVVPTDLKLGIVSAATAAAKAAATKSALMAFKKTLVDAAIAGTFPDAYMPKDYRP